MTQSAGATGSGWETYIVFCTTALLLAALSLFLLSRGYVNADALSNWANVIGTVSAEEVRLEHFGLVYPHLPLYALVPFYFVEALRSPAAPHLLSSLLAAGLLSHLYAGLRQRGWNRRWALPLLLLIVIHPAFLWPATNGSAQVMSLLLFYLVVVWSLELRPDGSSRVHMILGGLLAAYFFADARSLYVAASLVPLIALIGSRDMLDESPASMYVVVFLPFVFAFLAWAYLGWMALEDPWLFLQDPTSAFRGAAAYAEFVPWLRTYGGELLVPLAVGIGGAAACAPFLLWLLWGGDASGLSWEVGVFTLALPAVSLAIATYTSFAAHPAAVLFLVIGCVAAVVRRLPRRRVAAPLLAVLLLLGAVGGWAAFARWPPEAEGQRWIRAVRGDSVEAPFTDELALGVWLRDKSGVLLGTELGYPAIVARGTGSGLRLPFTTPFQVAVVSGQLNTDYVAVADPNEGRGGLTSLNRTFPRLYEAGHPGYVRVYDHRGWRVYRREGIGGPSRIRTLGSLPTGVLDAAATPPGEPGGGP